MLSTPRAGFIMVWLLLIGTFLFFGAPPAWAEPVLHPANQSVTEDDFDLYLPQIVKASTQQEVIFADDFEAGNFSSWSASKTYEDALSVTSTAALVGTQGLQVKIAYTTSVYLTDDLPAAEPRYSARFYFDPNSIVMVDNDNHAIFYGYNSTSDVVLRIQFRYAASDYQLRAGLLEDSTTFTNTGWITISDAPHALEVDWQAASAVDANDGSLTFWIDDVPTADLTGCDNDTRSIDRVRLGAVASIDPGTHGTYYFDAFESHRQTSIGPEAGALVTPRLP